MIKRLARGLLQKTKTKESGNFAGPSRNGLSVVSRRTKAGRPRTDRPGNIKTKPEHAGYYYLLPRCLPPFGSSVEDPNTPPTTRRRQRPGIKKNAPCAIARPILRVECVGSGHGGAVVVLVSRARSFVWCGLWLNRGTHENYQIKKPHLFLCFSCFILRSDFSFRDPVKIRL